MVNPDVLSQPQYKPVFEQNIEMSMRDGTSLRANVTRPNVAPVVRLPYNKDGGSEVAFRSPIYSVLDQLVILKAYYGIRVCKSVDGRGKKPV